MLEIKSIGKTISYNIIYIFTVPNIECYSGFCKIGKTSISACNKDWKSISQQEIEERAKKRIKEITSTAGLSFKLEYATIAVRKNGNSEVQFSDSNFHSVLKQNLVRNESPSNIKDKATVDSVCKSCGSEWFKLPAKQAIEFIKQYKDGKINLESNRFDKIVLREPQINASDMISKAWNKIKLNAPNTSNKPSNKFLLNAIMRFGKCITTYDFILKNNIQRVLILTHRPVVAESWRSDFSIFFNNENDLERKNKNYHYLTKKAVEDGEKYDSYKGKNLIYFASIQDLRGLEWVKEKDGSFAEYDNGDRIPLKDNVGDFVFKQNNREIFEDDWDLVIIDEAHEGNLTELAEEMHAAIKRKFSLYLSGTPYNIINEDNFEEEFGNNIFVFDQKKEAEAKIEWTQKHGTDHNPYDDIPNLAIAGISISNDSKNFVSTETGFDNNYFDFTLFFQLDEENQFVNKDAIIAWLDNISSKCDDIWLENMPFHIKNRFHTKHSIWYLPYDVKKADALQVLLQAHPFFKNYKIFNVCGSNYDNKIFQELLDDTNDEQKCSITLTIGRLTQGVTVPGWTAILLLNNTTSPMKYFQSIYRVKSPSPKNWITQKTCAQVYDFNPDRMLDLIDRVIKNTMKSNEGEQKYETVCREVVNYFSVLILKDNALISVDSRILKDVANHIKVNRVVNGGFKSTELLDMGKIRSLVDNLDYSKIKEKIIELENLQGKTGKSYTDISMNKITNNEFDEKIFLASENDKSALTASEVDREITDDKSRKKLIYKIKSFMLTVATRLPFMLIGRYYLITNQLDGTLKNFNIDQFCSLFDDEDWKEIMQSLQKKEFKKQFVELIDMDVFISSCELYIKKIRNIVEVKNPLERRDMWVELFKLIHNPDCETVLTPWRVVKNQYEISGIDWHESYKTNKTFIDINSKSAFYPLFAACKLYEEQLKCGLKDWGNITFHRIYAICRTNLTKDVARVILNYKDSDKNIQVCDIVKMYELDISERKNNWEEIVEGIMKKFNEPKLKFDYCISNPPYQLPVISDRISNNKAAANNIYDKFVLIGKTIADTSCMIFPAKWMTGGKGLAKFREEILNSKNIKHLIDCEDYQTLFPTISLHCGLTILLTDKEIHSSTKISYMKNFELTNTTERQLNEYDVLVIDPKKYEILKSIEKKLKIKSFSDWLRLDTMDKRISPRKPYGLSSNFYCNKSEKISLADEKDVEHDIKIYYVAINKEHKNIHSKGNRLFSYINRNNIKQNVEGINNYKVCIPIARGGDRDGKSILSKTIICEPGSICSESYRICGTFATEKEAKIFSYFMESKILRLLVSIRKLTQNAPRDVYKFVPYVDVINNLTEWQSEKSDTAKRTELDKELMDYLGLNVEQQRYVLKVVNEISNNLEFDMDESEDFDDDEK